MRSHLASSFILVAACGGGSAGPTPDATPLTGDGQATYTHGEEVFRIAAVAGASAQNVTAALGGTGDRRLVPSPGGAWLVMEGTRYGCGGQCLVRVAADLTSGEAVLAGGAEVYPEGISAITDDGASIVFPSQEGPHEVDLWVTTRDGTGEWSNPTLLTGASTYPYNNMPALRRAGDAVLFDCGTEPYPEGGGNDACSVGLDASGFARVAGPDDVVGAREDKVQNPHEGPDGILLEASWPLAGGESPEIIWLVPTGGGAPEPLGASLPNSVAPCALPDGRWVTLWLGGPGNSAGAHELTLVERDGSNPVVLTPGLDVADIGLGCGA